MNPNDDYSIGDALLCIQRSLLDAVTPDLRAVVIDLYEDQWCMFSQFYYDGTPPENDIERWNCAITEASAGMGATCSMYDKIERLDFPKPIPFLGPSANGGYLAFLRWEPEGPKIDPANVFPLSQANDIASIPEAYALLAASNALLGKISPTMRAVTVEVPPESTILRIRFFHDGEISAEITRLWEQAASEICSCMGVQYFCDSKIIRADFSQTISIPQGRIAYFRKEPKT